MHHQSRGWVLQVVVRCVGLKIGSMHLTQFSFTVLVLIVFSTQFKGSQEENKIYPSTTCLYLHVVDGIIQIETTLIHFYFLLHILNNLFLAYSIAECNLSLHHHCTCNQHMFLIGEWWIMILMSVPKVSIICCSSQLGQFCARSGLRSLGMAAGSPGIVKRKIQLPSLGTRCSGEIRVVVLPLSPESRRCLEWALPRRCRCLHCRPSPCTCIRRTLVPYVESQGLMCGG